MSYRKCIRSDEGSQIDKYWPRTLMMLTERDVIVCRLRAVVPEQISKYIDDPFNLTRTNSGASRDCYTSV